jgi:uncharacterized caspase-like protein
MTAQTSYSEKIDLSGGCNPEMYPTTADVIAAATKSMTNRDSLFIFLSGHGIRGTDGQFYFLRQDTNLDRLSQTSNSWSGLMSAIASTKGRVFLFLDACHSGQAGRLLANDDLVTTIRVSSNASVFVIAASKGRQRSWENAAGHAGYFGSAISNLIRDGSAKGGMSLGTFYRTLKSQVVNETDGIQTPWMSSTHRLEDVTIF